MSSIGIKYSNLLSVFLLIIVYELWCYACDYTLIELSTNKTDYSLLELAEKNYKGGKINYAVRGGGPGGSIGYSASFIQSSKERSKKFSSSNKNRVLYSPTVEYVPIEHMRGSEFVGEIRVGTPGKVFKPIFDTGSANTWVVSTECDLPTCKKVAQFNPSESSTFKERNERNDISVYFGNGMIKGYMASDTVQISNITLPDQNIALVQYEGSDGVRNIGSNIFEKLNFEGIFGLAFPEMSVTKDTIFQNFVRKKGVRPEFAFYISPDNNSPSYLLIGGTDKRFYEGEIAMLPLIREHYWELSLKEFWIGSENLSSNSSNQPSYLILDSGTALNTMPHSDYKQFVKLAPPIAKHHFSKDKIANYPRIKYVLGEITFEIEPMDYMILSEGYYKPGYIQLDVPSIHGKAYVLGTNIFMKRYFTVFKHSFDGNPSMIGFAKSKTRIG